MIDTRFTIIYTRFTNEPLSSAYFRFKQKIMKNIFAFTVLFILTGCTEKAPSISAQNSDLCRSVLINPSEPYDHEYDLKLSVEDSGNNQYRLVSVIDFHNGAFTASPLSNNDFKGLFKIVFTENDKFTLDDSFQEIPRSVEKIDQFGNLVNWVSERTTYKRTLTIKPQEDFKVSGLVSFTIEPTCTFEEIPFDIFYENGKLRIQQYPKLDKRTCSIPVLEVSMYDSPNIDHEVAKNHPYDVEFKVEKTEEGDFKLVTLMDLHGGSFFVSPNTKTGFKGVFRIEIAPNKNLSIEPDFIESPRTKTVIDPHRFVHDPVNWVSEDTKYEHPLKVHSEADFEIGGKLIFVIEPKCTLEEVPVLFKYKNDVLTVEKWKC
jgi:hypothetical protein